MAAILGLDETRYAAEACAEAAQGEVVEAANLNSTPGADRHRRRQGAPSSAPMAVPRPRGAKRAVLLPVSPFHCALMKPAAERLAPSGRDRDPAGHRCINNVDVAIVETDPDRPDPRRAWCARPIAGALGRDRAGDRAPRRHPRVRVRPGKVLAGMTKRIEGSRGRRDRRCGPACRANQAIAKR